MYIMYIRNVLVGMIVVVFFVPSCGGGGDGKVSKLDVLDVDVVDVVDIVDMLVIVFDFGQEFLFFLDMLDIQFDGNEGECVIDDDCMVIVSFLGVCDWVQCVEKNCVVKSIDNGMLCDDND